MWRKYVKTKKYDLDTYRYSKKVVKDIPEIIKILDLFQRRLYKYNEYFDVGNVMWSINDCKFMLELGMKRYEEVNQNKGEVTDE